MEAKIRSTSKAIIVRDGKVLLNRCSDTRSGAYYTLPGGGQHQHETMTDAVVRECLEETGYTVCPERLAAVCEDICTDEAFQREWPDFSHRMLHIFYCSVADVPRVACSEQDKGQIESLWVSIEALPSLRILPELVGARFTDILNGTSPLYIGAQLGAFSGA